jgi:hypothetical protein
VAPLRQDPAEIFALNVRVTEQLWNWLDRVDRAEIRERLTRNDFIGIRKMMEPFVFPANAREIR